MTAATALRAYQFLDTAVGDSLMPVFGANGSPTNGTAGTFAGVAGPGSLLVTTEPALYQNTNTKASPTWTLVDVSGSAVSAPSAALTGQSATVAPLTLTAGTLNTAAAAGALEFDGAAFYATAVGGARQQVDAEQFCILAADNSATGRGASAFPVFNSTTLGAVTLAAGKQYAFEGVYILTNVNTTSHTWATLFGGAATLTSINYAVNGVTSTASTPASGGLSGWANAATAVVATAAQTSATENVVIQINGVLTVNAGGTFVPQLQASANLSTGAQVVKAGSFFRIWEMSSAATVGAWT